MALQRSAHFFDNRFGFERITQLYQHVRSRLPGHFKRIVRTLDEEIGYLREGCLADILLVDGDPLTDITVLQDKKRILAVMKDGVFAKQTEIASQRRWERAA